MLNNMNVRKIPDHEVSTSLAKAQLVQETRKLFLTLSHWQGAMQKVICSFPGFWHEVQRIRFALLQNSL